MPRDGKDPCAPFRGGLRGVSRACYAALWAERCTTERWRDNWRINGHAYQQLPYEELVRTVDDGRAFRCLPYRGDTRNCAWLAATLDSLTQQLFIGALPERSRFRPQGRERDDIGDDVLDLADTSKAACPYKNAMVRVLFQRVPELYTNATRIRAAERRLPVGVPFQALRNTFLSAPVRSLIVGDHAGFAALRAASEAPLSRMLRRWGLPGIDECAVVGFHGPVCSGEETDPGGRVNVSLLATFYRHRDPGLPLSYTNRLMGSKDPFLRISGRLALADRLRNLGSEYLDVVQTAFEELQSILISGVSVEQTLPDSGPPRHLVWHLLDKLSLRLTVTVPVQKMKGATTDPHMDRLEMSVAPDRDIISDYIRSSWSFHCPASFMELVTEAAEARPDEVVRVAEVGGFLGDCVLWAAAWLGPRRLRALEVEPVAMATARLEKTLVTSGLSDAVSVLTEPLGDGEVHSMDSLSVCSRSKPSHPNFSVRRHLVDNNPDRVDVSAGSDAKGCEHRLRALDDVLEAWPELPAGASIDVVRVKAAGSEPLIVAGLRRHLAGSRVRRLHVETGLQHSQLLSSVMQQYPQYALDDLTSKRYAGSKWIYKLVE